MFVGVHVQSRPNQEYARYSPQTLSLLDGGVWEQDYMYMYMKEDQWVAYSIIPISTQSQCMYM